MPRAIKAGFDTSWTTFGQGPRAALMIHCSLASSASWGGLARHMSGALTMTAFDMPGHGRSGEWDSRGEMQSVTAAIAADFLETPADLIGHSFGATVALRLAAQRPELVRTLTLIEPVFFAVAIADRPDVARDHAELTAGFDAAMQAGNFVDAARAFTEIWGDGTPFSEIPEARQKELAAQMRVVEAGVPAISGDAGGLLRSGGLARVAMPTLIIEGSESPRIITAICEGLERRLPDAHRAIIHGAGHMVPLTHARAVSMEILRFLRENPTEPV